MTIIKFNIRPTDHFRDQLKKTWIKLTILCLGIPPFLLLFPCAVVGVAAVAERHGMVVPLAMVHAAVAPTPQDAVGARVAKAGTAQVGAALATHGQLQRVLTAQCQNGTLSVHTAGEHTPFFAARVADIYSGRWLR